MKLSESGASDVCEQALRAALLGTPELAQHNERHLRKALRWYRGEATEDISLLECMIVVRLTNDEFAVQLDLGESYRYLRFDTDRNRVVVIDPENMNAVPVEETEVHTVFDQASISFTTTDAIGEKTYSAVTAVTHPEHGTKLVFGRYPDNFTHYTADGDEITYESKTVFELPRPMSHEEVTEWLDSTDAEDVKQILRENHNRRWKHDR